MNIQIESNNVCVAVNTKYDCSRNELLSICDKMYDTMIEAAKVVKDEKELTPDSVFDFEPKIALLNNTQDSEPKLAPSKDAMVIRPRIPNNVVDINDLSIEKAVTENALVRCPKCGQAHCLAVPSGNHIYLMRRDFKDNEFGIIAEFDSLNSEDFVNVCCKPETDRQAYYQDLQNMKFDNNVDFIVNNDTEIFCPVCCNSNAFSLWKDAFENPLAYFETECLCDACGGEKIDKFIRKSHIYQCDKCGLKTDFKEDK